MQPSEKIRKRIKKNRPNITDSSLNSYIISLRMLYSMLTDDDEDKLKEQLGSRFLHDFSDIKKLVEMSKTDNTKKNRLTAILVALSSEKKPDAKLIEKYQVYLKSIMMRLNKTINSQEKTDTQEKNWLTYDEVKSILNKMLEMSRHYIDSQELTRVMDDDIGVMDFLSITKDVDNNRPLISVFVQVNDDVEMPEGSLTQVQIAMGNGTQKIMIPVNALLEDYGSYSVMVQLSGESFERRLVKIGKRNGENVEIVKGLEVGEVVVTIGAYQVKMASMSGSTPAHGHEH